MSEWQRQPEVWRGAPRDTLRRRSVGLIRNIRVQLHVRPDVDKTGELGDQ